jgi:hypothetical protein
MKLKEWIQMEGKEIWQKEWLIKRMICNGFEYKILFMCMHILK